MTTPALGRVTARHWMVVTGAGLLMGLNVLWFIAAGLLLPPLAVSLGIGLGQAMVFVSINMLSGAAVMAVAGPFLLRRLGARWLSVLGGLTTGASLFAVSFVGDLETLYALAFVSGLLASVSLQLTGAALVNDWFVDRRGLMQGLIMGIASMGGIVAGSVLPGVVNSGGWQAGFQLVGGLTAGIAVLAGALLIRSHPADVGLRSFGAHHTDEGTQTEVEGMPSGLAMRTPQFAALVIGLALFCALMALQQHFPPLLGERGVSLTMAGTLLSVLSLANVAATLLLGGLTDRRGTLFAYVISGALLMGALTLFLVTTGLPAQAVAVLLFSLPAVTAPILTPLMLRATFGRRAFVPLLGVATASMPVGIAVGSPLWGFLKDATGGYALALVIAIVVLLLSVALVGYAVLTGPRLWHQPSQSKTIPIAN